MLLRSVQLCFWSLKAEIPLVHLCAVISNASYEWASHYGLSAIRSVEYTHEGVLRLKDGGLQCPVCYDFWIARGNSNP